MLWIWKDKNFFKREIKAFKSTMVVGVPIFGINLLLWYLTVFDIVVLKEYLILVCLSSVWILSIISFIYKLPNSYILEEYSNKHKRRIRLVQLVGASFGFYLFTVGILQHHFLFFENLVCCDLVRNFNLDF